MPLNQNPQSSSRLRYFLARFKPLSNYLVWGPPVVILLVAGIIWQYQQHPEWLGQFAQPSTTQFFGVGENFDPDGEPLVPIEGENEQLDGLEDPLSPNFGNSGDSPSPILANPLNPTEGQPLSTENPEQTPSIFPNLVPNSSNSANSNSLFPSISQPSSPVKPVKPLDVNVPPIASPSPALNQTLPPSSLDSFAQSSASNSPSATREQRPRNQGNYRNEGGNSNYSGVNPQIPPTNYNSYPYGNNASINQPGAPQAPVINYYPYGNQPINPSVSVPQTPISTYRNQPYPGGGTQVPSNPNSATRPEAQFQPSLDNEGF